MKNFVQQGDNIVLVESTLAHPAHTDNLVDSGDQVIVGAIIGVANFDAAASTDKVTVSTRGVYNLSVEAKDANGDSAVAIGDVLYIDSAAAAKINKNATKTRCGIALGAVDAGATAKIDVKINA